MLLMQQQELSGSNGYIMPFNCFSLRKHNPNYTGYCMKVERDSDNAQMDVGFDVNGLIDTGSILSWSGSDSVYVREWYNQGLQGASMITRTYTARIVDAGVVDIENGLPIIRVFPITGEGIYLNTGFSPINNYYINNDNYDFTEIIVGKDMQTVGCTGDPSTFNVATGYGHYIGSNKNQMRHNSTATTFSGTSLVGGVPGIYCFNQSFNGNLATLTLNGVDNTTPTAMPGTWAVGVSITRDVQEVILYDFSANDVSATYQNELSAEVNAYWGVY